MAGKNLKSIIVVCIVILLAVGLGLILSRRKPSSQPASPVPKKQTVADIIEEVKTEEVEDVNEAEKPVPPSSTLQAPSAPNEPNVEQTTIAKETTTTETQQEQPSKEQEIADTNNKPKDTNVKLVPIEIKLPKPMFVGTPQDARVPNLEKPLGKPRPPFYAPEGTKNVALGKPVTSSDEEPIIGELEMITDGDKEATDGSYVELGPFRQHITIDLQAEYEIYAIVIWHYHKQPRVYFDVIVQVSNDPDFITGVTTLFNNDIDNSAGLGVGTDMHYTETNEGKLIDAKGVRARYVRCYSNGNNANDLNHYIEVEVYGRKVK